MFRVLESRDPDGAARLAIDGVLDTAAADTLSARLGRLECDGVCVRLDMSGVVFIDRSGLRVIVTAVRSGRRDGEPSVEIDPDVSGHVRRLFELIGLSQLLDASPVP